MVKLGDVCSFISGGTPSKKNLDFYGGDIPWVTGADLSTDGWIHPRHFITTEAVARSAASVVEAGTVLLVTRTAVGKVVVADRPLAFSQDVTALKSAESVDTRYLVHFLHSQAENLKVQSRGATIKGVTRDVVKNLQLRLPELEEQRRIAAILDKADEVRAKRQQMLDHLDTLPQAIFHDMFANAEMVATLGELAVVSSGITKGRKSTSELVEVPYLAVSNVQAGHLKLDVVKTIAASEMEIQRYMLREGDVVLTEGGDPDKLGRGTVWRSQIPVCIHQNHVFRVRFQDDSRILPDFFAAFLDSPDCRKYFLRSAKQTTGIASINMTQLRGLPVAVPEPSEQKLFVRRIALVNEYQNLVQQQLSLDSDVFAALQAKAFRGEL
ncbi:restriction endonuclease subunit S [Populibacterium corticicola]|uniref:Restriction endonuclease subunit S n=1 Tax=Populibacterium corticicola TaxID=1812826 RepID=A0ABW5XBA2_9MICO